MTSNKTHLLNDRRPLVVLKEIQEDGKTFSWHRHTYSQLIFSESGLYIIRTKTSSWAVPPGKAVWIPYLTEHETSAVGNAAYTILNIHKDAKVKLPDQCIVIEVSEFLKAAVNELSTVPMYHELTSADASLVEVILDRIEAVPRNQFHLQLPNDPRIRAVAEEIIKNPQLRTTLDDWAQRTGASTRTISRLFKSELGMPFGKWRSNVVMHSALQSLAAGKSVTEVAFDLGFCSQSAFSVQFKKEMGFSPRAYIQTLYARRR